MLSRAALMAVVLLLGAVTPAVPVARAQSAGDEQYQDPFAGQGGGASGGGQSGSSDQSSPAPPAATSPPASAAAATTPAPAPSSQLPRTGGDALLLGVGGAGLVLAGVALRLRLRVDGDRRR
jgi:hypothetical protein